MSGKTGLLWHYTTLEKINLILESGFLFPATAYVPENEKPILWFSTRQDYEPTARKAVMNPDGTIRTLSFAEMVEIGIGRIGVPLSFAPLDWREIRRKSGMTREHAQKLADVTTKQGSNVSTFRGTFEAISVSQFKAIERYDAKACRWVQFERGTK